MTIQQIIDKATEVKLDAANLRQHLQKIKMVIEDVDIPLGFEEVKESMEKKYKELLIEVKKSITNMPEDFH